MRRTRRKIRRRKRDKKRPRQKKTTWVRHLNCVPTNKWTKLTTYFMMLFETVFVIWWLQETLLYWQEILVKLRNLFNCIYIMGANIIDGIQMLIEKIGGIF